MKNKNLKIKPTVSFSIDLSLKFYKIFRKNSFAIMILIIISHFITPEGILKHSVKHFI